MNLLHPPERGHGKAAELTMSGEGDGVMKAVRADVQADVKLLKATVVALAVTTCLLGTAAVMAMS